VGPERQARCEAGPAGAAGGDAAAGPPRAGSRDAIEEAALTKWHGHTDVYSVDGHPLDFAKAASVAVVEALAVDMDAHGGAGYAALMRMLANSVREVA
jgi:hypothetical protein